ncbi:MAG: hypothetical protein GX957_03295 [Clostridiaceae bacterium]|nr:hypothetical protein [Clostridiaceae bacterium]
MKLGLIGHSRTIAIVIKIMSHYFPDVEITQFPMDTADIAPVVSFIKENEHHFDGLLFTGKVPYDLVNSAIISKKPWMYIQHDTSRFLSGLLEASFINGFDIRKISIDSYSEEDVYLVYENLKIPKEQLNICICKNIHLDDEYLENIRKFHHKNYENGNVDVCITGISGVYEYLSGLGIPCIVLDPTKQSIETAIKYYDIKKRSKLQKNSDIVVLAIERDLPDEYALIKENEYQLSLETMKISEEIYRFSQRIQAAVIEKEMGKYMLFATKPLFEMETEQLQKLNILTKQDMVQFGTLSIGIGYGETPREAKYNASLGLLKAKKKGGNQAYKVENNQYLGPFVLVHEPNNSPEDKIDGYFQEIASATGISLNSILKLQTIMDINKKDTFTPLELAKAYGVSLRSMNRLLEKLLDNNHARIIGHNMRNAAGRPSRIIRLNFNPPNKI